MTHKSTAEWMKEKLERYKDTFDFKLEELILDITEEMCRAMEEKGIGRAELADELGVSRAFVSKLLNGTPNLTIKTLMKMTDALGRELSIKMPPSGFTTPHLYVPIKGKPMEYKPSINEKTATWEYAANDIDFADNKGLSHVR